MRIAPPGYADRRRRPGSPAFAPWGHAAGASIPEAKGSFTVPKRVLVVDDDPGVVRLVRATLQAEGLEVTAATNGAECLLAVEAQRPDLIILDVAMPVLDGFETFRLLRAKPETLSIPVIMLTARRSDAEVVQGWASGVDLYLTKPFEARELLAVTRRMLDIAETGETVGEGGGGR